MLDELPGAAVKGLTKLCPIIAVLASGAHRGT